MFKRKRKVSPGVAEWQHTQEQMDQAVYRELPTVASLNLTAPRCCGTMVSQDQIWF